MGAPGAIAHYFRVMPPAGRRLPINAALLASHHQRWVVKVLDGANELPIDVEGIRVIADLSSYLLLRPRGNWPVNRALEIVATPENLFSAPGVPAPAVRSVIRTASEPSTRPPRCAWSGPIAPVPCSGDSVNAWGPTGIPRPNPSQRNFPLHAVECDAGEVLLARIVFEEAGQRDSYHFAMRPGAYVELPVLPPPPRSAISDEARIVSLELEDLAGQTTRYS